MGLFLRFCVCVVCSKLFSGVLCAVLGAGTVV